MDRNLMDDDNPSESDDELLAARRNANKYRAISGGGDDDENDSGGDDDENDSEGDDSDDEVGVDSEDDAEYVPISDNVGDFDDSTDPDSISGTSDEGNGSKVKPGRENARRTRFRSTNDEVDFAVGMLFTSANQFREAVHRYAIRSRRDIKIVKNEPLRIRVKCKGSITCNWSLFASQNRDLNSFQVKTFNNEHKCEERHRVTMLKTSMLAEKFRDTINMQPNK